MEMPKSSLDSPTKKNKESKPTLEKIVTGEAKVHRKAKTKNFISSIINEDADNLKEYVIFDWFLPNLKNGIMDIVEIILFGRTRGRTRNSGSGYTSYGNSSLNNGRRDRQISARNKAVHNFDDIVIESRGEAERVLDILQDLVEQYGEASLYDFYVLVGIDHNDYVDKRFGWCDLRQARIVRVRDGYMFDMPRCVELD